MCVLWFCHAVFGDTINLDAAADTTISDGGLNSAGGSDATMVTGRTAGGARARGLMRFDLSSIPAGSVINSASMTITVYKNHLGVSTSHNLHRLLQDWTEGGATWAGSGLALWPAGGNFVANQDASTTIGSVGSFTFTSTAQLLGTVRMWYTNSASNFGWVFRDQDEETSGAAIRWYTHESGLGPTLVIDYTPPPPPPPPPATLTNLRVADGNFMFDFVAVAGNSYTVQVKDTVNPGGWNTWITYPDPGTDTVITVSDPLGDTQRFFQVVSP